jgi:hypothetical protein
MSLFRTTDTNDFQLATNAKGKKTLVLERSPSICGAFKLKHRLQFFEGEWYLDTRQGVPYFRIVFIKNPDFSAIRSMLRRVILSIPAIVNVTKLQYQFDPKTRELDFYFEAIATDGIKVTGGAGKPFIVGGEIL